MQDGKWNTNMKKAFTLTEIIITLFIVGIIAALTIPAIIKNYREKIYSTQLKKVVSQIENATKTVMSEEHSQSFHTTTAGIEDDGPEQGSRYFLGKYLKYTIYGCKKNNAHPCVAPGYKTLDGTDAGESFGSFCILTSNGAAVCMWNNPDANCINTNDCTLIAMDVNGTDPPNIIGIDMFTAQINSAGQVVDVGTDESKCGIKTSNYGHILDYGQGCLLKVMNNNWKIKEE